MARLATYKYDLQVTDEQTLTLPLESKILDIQFQRHALCLWALVDPVSGTPTVQKVIRIFGTGQILDDEDLIGFEHLKTLQQGSFVWHLFIKE